MICKAYDKYKIRGAHVEANDVFVGKSKCMVIDSKTNSQVLSIGNILDLSGAHNSNSCGRRLFSFIILGYNLDVRETVFVLSGLNIKRVKKGFV